MKLPWTPFYILIVIFIALLVWVIHNTGKQVDFPCSKSLSVDITNGSQIPGGMVMDSVFYNQSDIFSSDGRTWGCICNIRKCIRKCCAWDEIREKGECKKDITSFFNATFYEGSNPASEARLEDFFKVHGRACINESFKIFIPKNEYEEYIYLQANGSLMLMQDGKATFYHPDSYCFEEEDGKETAILCDYLPDDPLGIPFGIPIGHVGMMISIPFLFVTFLIYAILPESSLHRKALMFYVLALLITYICLLVPYFDTGLEKPACQFLGLCIIFFSIVSFLWMNVMCIDMWLTFRDFKGFNGNNAGENKKLIIYCLYAWGLPLVHVFIVFMINTYGDDKSAYYPNIGTWRCFIEGGLTKFIFYYPPLIIVIIINIVLFILTIIRIRKVKNEIVVLKRTDSRRNCYKNDKQRFNLYIKLTFVMGINWLLELISSVVHDETREEHDWVFVLADIINSLYGVIIFVIFVCKKKTWTSLKMRYYVCIGKPHLAYIESVSGSIRTAETEVNPGHCMRRMRT